MLGLGNSLVSSSTLNADVFSFSKSLLADNDFSDYSVQGGSLTFTANQSAPDGSTGWLKVVYPATDQTDTLSGILNDQSNATYFLSDWAAMSTPRPGSTYTLKFDIYLEGTDEWGTDDVKTTGLVGGYGVALDVPVDTAYSFSKQSSNLLTNQVNPDLKIYWVTAGDKPLGGATFYIKNISVVIHP